MTEKFLKTTEITNKQERLSKKYDFSDSAIFSELDQKTLSPNKENKENNEEQEEKKKKEQKEKKEQNKKEKKKEKDPPLQKPLTSKKTTLSKLISFLKQDSIQNAFIIGPLVSWILPLFETIHTLQNTKKSIIEFTEKFSLANIFSEFFTPNTQEKKKQTTQKKPEKTLVQKVKSFIGINKNKTPKPLPKNNIEKKETLTSPFQKMLALGEKHLGGIYSWGKKEFTTEKGKKGGLDCSGFTQALYKSIGIQIPKASFLQADDRNAKKITNPRDLQKGDLIFFLTDKKRAKKEKIKVTHVAMYIGNGEIIHARSSAKGIRKDKLKGGDFHGEFQWARRYPLKNTQNA